MFKLYHYQLLLLFFSPIFLTAQSPFNLSQVQKLEIDFYDNYWENKLKAYKKTGSGKRLAAKFVLGEMSFDSVGVRFKGNSSYNNPKKKENRKLPFNIDINEFDEDAKFPDGTNKIKLSNSFRDPSYMREVLSYEIIRNYLPAPKTSFYHLIINGEDLGIYVGSNSINKQFLKSNFGTKKGKLFKCDPDFNTPDTISCAEEKISNLGYFSDPACYKNRYELKSKKGWPELENLIDLINNRPEEMESSLAIYEVLWMHALNNALMNLDSYAGRLSHNYYLYRDTASIWHPLMWDLNLSFGGFVFDGLKNGGLSLDEMIHYSVFAHLDNPERPFISQLLKTTTYRKVYVHMVKTICEDYLINGKYKEMIADYYRILESKILTSPKNLYPAKTFSANITSTVKIGNVNIVGIEELIEGRMKFLQGTPIFAPDQPKVLDHQTETAEGLWQLKLTTTFTDKVVLRIQKHPGGKWESLSLNRGEDHWALNMPEEDQPYAYFFILENASHASLYPKNAPRSSLKSD